MRGMIKTGHCTYCGREVPVGEFGAFAPLCRKCRRMDHRAAAWKRIVAALLEFAGIIAVVFFIWAAFVVFMFAHGVKF